MSQDGYHIPVMAQQCIQMLDIKPDGIYIDVTFGGGGHSRLILEQLGPQGRLIGFDQDEDARANALDDPRFTFIPHNFRTLRQFLRVEGIRQCDGILADLGVSSHQFDEADRGFSYRFDADLDMRMNQEAPVTAATIINTREADELQRIFGEYGEVRNAKTLAQRIVTVRQTRPLVTINDLLKVADPIAFQPRPKYLAQVFQALRIEVNDELGALREFLTQTLEVLRPEGRLVVMSYHSLEDRLVKNFFKMGNFDGTPDRDFFGNINRPWNIVTRKAIEPNEAEIAQNSRARSAKLRVAAKK